MSTIYDWMKEGFTPIPNSFFNQFKSFDLTSDEGILLLYILSQINQGRQVKDIQYIENQLGWPSKKVYDLLNRLLSKNYLAIELRTDEAGKQTDHYTLRPFFEQVDQDHFLVQKAGYRGDPGLDQGKELVQAFEQEFGRVLTPIELETLQAWLSQDQYPVDLIRIALREAVIHQALSFNYIDKILLNWEKANIRTGREAEAHIKAFANKKRPAKQTAEEAAWEANFAEIEMPILKNPFKDPN